MDLRVLRYFLTVAREQSFTKAAEQLNITQPTLSRQLAALEEELGAKLFNRGGHQITLTNEGLLLKRRALEIVDLEDKIVSEFKGNNDSIEGKITIGCGEFLAVESLANWFGKDFGKLHIAFTSNLGTNAGVMALHGLGYPISIEGAARYWRNDLVVQKRLFPELKTSTVIAWRRNIPYSPAESRFIEELNQIIDVLR